MRRVTYTWVKNKKAITLESYTTSGKHFAGITEEQDNMLEEVIDKVMPCESMESLFAYDKNNYLFNNRGDECGNCPFCQGKDIIALVDIDGTLDELEESTVVNFIDEVVSDEDIEITKARKSKVTIS